MTTDERYPVGRFEYAPGDAPRRTGWIEEIARLPERLRGAVAALGEAQLDTPYRDGGWTVRQVVHHLPDSHANAYIRFKLALTEETPRIKPYDEARWAELPDGRTGPLAPSLSILDGLHARWTVLLRGMGDEDFQRTLEHPEHGVLTLDRLLGMYAWHCRHHVAHITRLRAKRGW